MKNLSSKYQAAHMRVRRIRGKASEQVCVECGKQALDWAYTGKDPEAVADKSWNGKGLSVYSTDPAYYQPMCRSCHLKMDAEQRRLNDLCYELLMREMAA